MHRLSCLLFFFLGFSVAYPCPARDVFVDNRAGDDDFTGLRATSVGVDGPLRTINRALRICRPADRIIIANSGIPYHESITLIGGRNSGFAGGRFEVVGNGAVLDGRQAIPRAVWTGYDDTFRMRPPHQACNIVYLGNRPARFHPIDGLVGEVPKLEPLEWTLADGYIWFRVERTKVIEDYPLSLSVLTVGISLYRIHDVVISDLTVQGFQLDGVIATDGVRDCRLIGLTCRGNGRSGITVANSSQTLIEDCLLGDNLRSQLRTEGLSHTLMFNSQLIDNTAPGFIRDGGELLIDGVAQGNEAPRDGQSSLPN